MPFKASTSCGGKGTRSPAYLQSLGFKYCNSAVFVAETWSRLKMLGAGFECSMTELQFTLKRIGIMRYWGPGQESLWAEDAHHRSQPQLS